MTINLIRKKELSFYEEGRCGGYKKPTEGINGYIVRRIWDRVVETLAFIFRNFYPVRKTVDFNRRTLSLKADGSLKPPSAQSVRERSPLTELTC